jgi:type I restriction enzyme S subunit
VTDLPDGWEWSTIGDMTEAVAKADPRRAPEQRFTYIDIGGIDGERGLIVEAGVLLGSEAPSRARQIVRSGDVVLSTVRTYMKKSAIVPESLDGAVASTGFCVLRPGSRVRANYLFHAVRRSKFVNELSALQTGSSYPAVRESDVRSMRIPLPPPVEQERIVDAIDARFSLIDAGESALRSAGAASDRLETSLVEEAVRGDWPMAPLGNVLRTLRNGCFVSRPKAVPPGLPILRISAVRPLRLDTDDVRYAPEGLRRADEYQLTEGDVLFTRYSGNPAYVGACAVVRPSGAGLLHPDKLIRGVPDERRVFSDWIALAVTCTSGRREIEKRLKTTAGQVGISGSQLRSLPIPLPPIEEQHLRVGVWRTGAEASARLGSDLERAKARANQLRDAVLDQALSGRIA